jgi:hypothetical protein
MPTISQTFGAVASASGNIGGAVSDLFAGFGAETAANLKAQGLQINAQGQLITAQGTILSAEGLQIKAAGDIAEGKEYDIAAALARQNEEYTRQSTAIQQTQLDRQITATIGGQEAGTGAAGLKESGSALDLLADSAKQGALAKSVLAEQGVITEAGYEEQAQSYDVMSAAAKATATGELDIATKTRGIADQQQAIAGQTMQLAYATTEAGHQQAQGDFISAAMKGVAAVAQIGALLA